MFPSFYLFFEKQTPKLINVSHEQSSGVWGFVCVWRWTMVLAWRDWFKARKAAMKANFMRRRTNGRDPRDPHSYRLSADRGWPLPTNGYTYTPNAPAPNDWVYYTLQTRRSSPAESSTVYNKWSEY